VPYDSSIRPKVIVVAVRPLGAEVVVAAALRASVSHLGFVAPQALQRGGLFVPAGVEPEFRL
jgi:hypothetical protein